MRARSSRRNPVCTLVCLAAIIVMCARIALTWNVFNDTADEPYHIGSAVTMVETMRHTRGTQHPPLTRLVVGAALKLAGVHQPQERAAREIQFDLSAFNTGHRVLLSSERVPYWRVLTVARAVMLIFPVVAVWYVYLIGRYVASAVPGCVAAVMFSSDPTLLGHGGVVATDVAAAAGFLAAAYHGVRFIARSNWRRALIAGVALGLALSCKFSCVLVIPALVPILVLRRRRALFDGPIRRYFSAWPRVGCVALLGCVAFVTLWATFLFDVGPIEGSPRLQQEPVWDTVPAWTKRNPIPMPSAVMGLAMLMAHNKVGHVTYLNGRLDQQGTAAYFPEALLLKLPAAVVVGLAAAVVMAIVMCRLPRRWGVTLFPFLIYMAVSMNSGLNIGIRHILPAIPMLYILLVQQLSLARVKGVAAAIVVTGLVFVETLAVHPDYLAFFNMLVGGPSRGDRYLLDSNLDWGQDQARLKRWLDEHARGRVVTVRLFGNPRIREWPHEGYQILPYGSSPRGLLVVSKNESHGLYLTVYDDPATGRRRAEAPLFGLDRFKRVAQIGYTIDVYDLDATPSANK